MKQQKKKKKKTYRQNWSAYNAAQTNEFTLFQDLLIELIDSTIQVHQVYRKNGRPYNEIKEMLFCCVMREFVGKSIRRSNGYLAYAKEKGYIHSIPHFNTILNYYRYAQVTGLLKHLIEQSALPLKEVEQDFAIDSSGFSTSMFGRWFNVRSGKHSERRLFRKAHVTSGVKTNIITSVTITEGYCADSPYFDELIRATAKNFEIREVSADAGYLARKNFDTVFELGAIPYIMFKKNSAPKARGSLIYKRMFDLYKKDPDYWGARYHKRSNSETVFHMLKKKFGLGISSKDPVSQENEVLIKCLCHNLCVLIQELFEAVATPNFEDCERKIVRGYCANN